MTAVDALRALAPALAFLLAGVPLAALLDRLGFFTAAARLVTAETSSLLGLWLFAAAVTIVLNLDTTVVLLTPLYLRLAERRRMDPLPLAVIPLLLASLASSLLPVSNLTNLIAAERTGLTTGGLVAHLGLPTLAAVAVGWLGFHRRHPVALAAATSDRTDDPDDADGTGQRALVRGGAVVGLVLVGFVAGPAVGVPAWAVALGADVVLVAMTGWVPWRRVPLATAAVVAAIGVAVTVAVPSSWSLLDRTSPADVAVLPFAATASANAVNNLPALLAVLPGTPTTGWGLYAWLLGVNAGAVLLPIGALANLLWLRVVRADGHDLRLRRYVATTVPVALPALVAGVAVLVIERLVTG